MRVVRSALSAKGGTPQVLLALVRTEAPLQAPAYALRGNVRSTGTTAAGGEPEFALIDRWPTPDPPVDHIRMWEKVEEHVTAPDVAYELSSTLTP